MKKINKKFNEIIENGIEYLFLIGVVINILIILNMYTIKIEYLCNLYNSYLSYILNNILAEDNRELLINILSILLGFIITIISVFGIGYSKATVKICEENLEKKFCTIAKKILCIATILLIIVFFGYDMRKIQIFTMGFFLLLIYFFIKFIVFGMIVLKMFNYNIQNSKKEFEEDEKLKKEIILLLRKMANVDNVNTGDYEKSKSYNEKIRNES